MLKRTQSKTTIYTKQSPGRVMLWRENYIGSSENYVGFMAFRELVGNLVVKWSLLYFINST
jgi:hypothetical protein